MKKTLLSTLLCGVLAFGVAIPVQANTAPSAQISWDTEPTPGQPSPAFTITLTVGVSASSPDKRIGGMQVYVTSLLNGSRGFWNLSTLGDGCNNASAKLCPIESTKIRPYRNGALGVLEDVPLSLLRSWDPGSNTGFLYQHRDYLDPNWVGFVPGDQIQIRVLAGAFEVPMVVESVSPRIYLTEYVVSGGSIGSNGFVQVNGSSFFEGTAIVGGSSDPVSPSLPVVAALDVNPKRITVRREIITVLGANLDSVTEVIIGGVRVPIFTQSLNRIQVRAPEGISGVVDLQLKSNLNDVLLANELNFVGGTMLTPTRKTLVVSGFASNSSRLTPAMKEKIERWLVRNRDFGSLTCRGFTSLPRRVQDSNLSTKRGQTACNFSKNKRSELEISVSEGIEDSRSGPSIRRVQLILTK